MSSTIHVGNVLDILPALEAESVNCVVTSPPYWGLRDYGVDGQLGLEATPEEYVANLVAVFREVKRILRDDGTLWLNLGDSYASSGGERTYGSSDNGTGRGPGARRHDVPSSGLKPKDLIGIPWRVAFALQAEGWYLRSDIIWSKPNPMPESVTDRPTKAHEYVFLLTKAARYWYDADAVKEGAAEMTMEDSRYGIDTTRDYEKADEKLLGYRKAAGSYFTPNGSTRNRRTVWTIATHPYPEAHFATYPEKLVEPCVLAGCPAGGTVLDPFCGSGTTGAVACRLGRNFVGVELNPEYAEMAERRIAPHRDQMYIGGLG